MTRRLFPDRRKERANQQMIQTRLANSMAGSIRSEIQSAMERGIDAFRKEGSELAIEVAIAGHSEDLRAELEAPIRRSAMLAGKRILGEAKSFHGRWERKQEEEGRIDDFENQVQAWLASEGLSNVVGIAATTQLTLQREVQAGLAMGESVDQIAERMQNKVAAFSAFRAMRIARTETHSAYNFGHDAGAQASELSLSKEWISAQDERTRDEDDAFNHEDADGEIVQENQKFVKTGEEMRYPGDHRGSAANVIHCRCGRGDIVN